MDTKLAQHFTYGKLLKFVFPSIVMMIFTSIYSVVDGLFVSNFVGKTAFASINLIMPFIMGLTALGFMMGTGGSAIVAKTLGEGKPEKANEYFSLIVYTTIIGGLILSILGMFLVRPVSILLGADFLVVDCRPSEISPSKIHQPENDKADDSLFHSADSNYPAVAGNRIF